MDVRWQKFGTKIRELRQLRGMTLRALADATGVDFTYLSKIENGKVPYTPSPETIRGLATSLDCDPLELLSLADKVPPELEPISGSVQARRFLERAREVARPEDWDALLDFLERRQRGRKNDVKEANEP